MGKIIKEAIKKSGKTVKQVANNLGISRNTLYSKFKLPYVRKDFILRLGTVLYYDFSEDIPGLKEYTKEFESLWGEVGDSKELNFAKKYFVLLEKYNQLLMFLLKISNTENCENLKKEIADFMKDNDY